MRINYTEKERKFFADYVPGHHKQEVAEEFERRFKKPITVHQVKSYMHTHKLKTGLKGSEGMTPHNKGKKCPEHIASKIRATQFKKGNIPDNHREVGSIRINTDKIREIKVAEPNKWSTYSRYIWEKEHGQLPTNMVLIHLNGDTLDDSIDNLMPITRNELARINQSHMISKNKELTETAIIKIRLETLVRKKENENR